MEKLPKSSPGDHLSLPSAQLMQSWPPKRLITKHLWFARSLRVHEGYSTDEFAAVFFPVSTRQFSTLQREKQLMRAAWSVSVELSANRRTSGIIALAATYKGEMAFPGTKLVGLTRRVRRGKNAVQMDTKERGMCRSLSITPFVSPNDFRLQLVNE